jgi:hypothetical protein
MKTYEVDIEDKTYEVDAPDEVTAWNWANQHHAQKVQKQKSDLAAARIEFDPMAGMNRSDKFFAGMGKRMMDIGTLGLREQPKSDAALMQDGWATSGGVVADVGAMLLGGAALKGASAAAQAIPQAARFAPALQTAGQALMLPNTATKAIATGGLYGFATDSGGIDERMKSGGLGAVGGAIFPFVGATAKATKSLVEPLTKKGQERIAARVLSQFGGDDLANASAQQFVKGSVPTTAEAVGNEGLSTLTQGLRNLSPQFADDLASRSAANRAARVGAVQSVAGDDAVLAALRENRDLAAETLYGNAMRSDSMRLGLANEQAKNLRALSLGSPVPDVGLEATPGIKMLMSRPAFKAALADGKTLADNLGENFAPNSLQSLHYAKLAIDEALNGNAGAGSALANHSKKALTKIKSQLLNEMEKVSPAYKNARLTYQDMSKPINQMEIGQELFNKMQSGLAQFGANTREQASSYANSMMNLDKVAEKVTGVKGIKAKDILTPEQINTLRGVAKDLARKAKTEDLARGVGSNTAKNLATTNLLRNAFGPLGLPQSWAESTALQTMFKPLNLVYGNVAEPRIADALGKGLLDVGEAQRLLQYLEPPKSSAALGWTPSLGIAYSSQQ